MDPEKPQTLEELEVVREDDVFVYRQSDEMWIRLEFTPTVPHCSLASLIGWQNLTCLVNHEHLGDLISHCFITFLEKLI